LKKNSRSDELFTVQKTEGEESRRRRVRVRFHTAVIRAPHAEY